MAQSLLGALVRQRASAVLIAIAHASASANLSGCAPEYVPSGLPENARSNLTNVAVRLESMDGPRTDTRAAAARGVGAGLGAATFPRTKSVSVSGPLSSSQAVEGLEAGIGGMAMGMEIAAGALAGLIVAIIEAGAAEARIAKAEARAAEAIERLGANAIVDWRQSLPGRIRSLAETEAGVSVVVLEAGQRAGSVAAGASPSVDTILELQGPTVILVEIDCGYRPGLQGCASVYDRHNFLLISLRLQLVGKFSNNVLYKKQLFYRSSSEEVFEEWIANDAVLLRNELEHGVDQIARRVVEEIFLIDHGVKAPFPPESLIKGERLETQPIEIYKQPDVPVDIRNVAEEMNKAREGFRKYVRSKTYGGFHDLLRMATWTKVGSLKPTLSWSAFPDSTESTVPHRSLSQVAYDLQVWQADQPAGPVYEREGLREPVHRLEEPLLPDTEYLWTVRARFRLDGQVRVTEWSHVQFATSSAVNLWTLHNLCSAYFEPHLLGIWPMETHGVRPDQVIVRPDPCWFRLQTPPA